MGAESLTQPTTPGVLAEAEAMPWRRRASERTLQHEGRLWTLWSIGIVVTFALPAALLIWIQPLAFPVSAILLGHGLAVVHLQARRGAGSEAARGEQWVEAGAGRARPARRPRWPRRARARHRDGLGTGAW